MNTFALTIWDNETEYVTYYSVNWEGTEKSEAEKFFEKYYSHPDYWTSIQELLSLLINSIGNEHGAKDVFFSRHANKASELPPKGTIIVDSIKFDYYGFPLRLFCLRISDNIVILFNGGIKSSQATQDSPDLRTKFFEAQIFAKRIEEAMRDGIIFIDNTTRTIKTFNGSSEIYL